jgi:hypothetical protein
MVEFTVVLRLLVGTWEGVRVGVSTPPEPRPLPRRSPPAERGRSSEPPYVASSLAQGWL